MKIEEKLLKYGKSKEGNFQVIDTIGVPHPYCITPKHVAYASDHFNGMLGKEAIIEAEKYGKAVCDICKGINRKDYSKPILTYDQHEQALLVNCKVNMAKNEELHAYLMGIKDLATKEHYAGFAFKKDF
jgi:hypothetical protein